MANPGGGSGGGGQGGGKNQGGRGQNQGRGNWRQRLLRDGSISAEGIQFFLSRLVGTLVKHNIKSEHAEKIKQTLASKLGGDEGVKNFLIPLLQVTANVPMTGALWQQLRSWGINPEWVDITNQAINDIFEEFYRQYDDIGKPGGPGVAAPPVHQPTYGEALSQLTNKSMDSRLAFNKILAILKPHKELKTRFEYYRSKLTHSSDLEALIAFHATLPPGEDITNAPKIVGFLEDSYGDASKPEKVMTGVAKTLHDFKESVRLVLPAGAPDVVATQQPPMMPLIESHVANNLRWPDARPVGGPGILSRGWGWATTWLYPRLKKGAVRLFDKIFREPPALPPANPPGPGGHAPGP